MINVYENWVVSWILIWVLILAALYHSYKFNNLFASWEYTYHQGVVVNQRQASWFCQPIILCHEFGNPYHLGHVPV